MATREHTGPLFFDLVALDQVAPCHGIAITRRCFALLRRRQSIDQRMLGREHHVRRAEYRIRTRREHAHRTVAPIDVEVDFGAFAAPDPVRLRLLGDFRPIEPGYVVEQSFGVAADPEEPLEESTLLDRRVAALA